MWKKESRRREICRGSENALPGPQRPRPEARGAKHRTSSNRTDNWKRSESDSFQFQYDLTAPPSSPPPSTWVPTTWHASGRPGLVIVSAWGEARQSPAPQFNDEKLENAQQVHPWRLVSHHGGADASNWNHNHLEPEWLRTLLPFNTWKNVPSALRKFRGIGDNTPM